MRKKNDNQDKVDLAVMSTNIEYIKREIDGIKVRLDSNYVTRVEFEPIKKVVYGLVGLFLIAIVGAIIRLVLQS